MEFLLGPWLIVPFAVRKSRGAARGAVTSLLVAPPAGTVALLLVLIAPALFEHVTPASEHARGTSWSGVGDLLGVVAIGFVYAYVLVGGWAAVLGAIGGRVLERLAERSPHPARAMSVGAIGGGSLGIVPVVALYCAGWNVTGAKDVIMLSAAAIIGGMVPGLLTGRGIISDLRTGCVKAPGARQP